ncbi:MAG: quinol:electron acceptor oxidoreductase subunit ActD [Polyangiaceae bacterium]|nr:quinol:electron acceptor oxidoreductase subunit ActD [Polyangiaceae bacterium]
MSEKHASTPESQAEAPLFGLLAEYNTPGELIEASKKVRDAGFTRWDTFTPFPVHGIDRAMGIRMTRLPWLVLGAALTGLSLAVWLQWWTNAVDYPWIVSGKPFWSLPANVPIMFELTVLFAGITAMVGMLVMNGLPEPAHPLDLKTRFARSTDDKFFLVVEARDPKFDEASTKHLLEKTHPVALEEVPEDRTTSAKFPTGLIYGVIVVTAIALVPFALFAKARTAKSRSTRIHAIADMDSQPKFKTQRENLVFDDGRSMREPVKGTVAHGQLWDDDHLYRGKVGDAWARTFPSQMTPNADMMARGEQRFGIYCTPCHGQTGDGKGMVHVRASTLGQGWVPPTNVHQEYLRQQPVGQLFDTITNGIRSMPAYGPQISAEDRWAIILYLRALQKSRAASLGELTAEQRQNLK